MILKTDTRQMFRYSETLFMPQIDNIDLYRWFQFEGFELNRECYHIQKMENSWKDLLILHANYVSLRNTEELL